MRTVTDPITAEDIALEVANQAGLRLSDLLSDLRDFKGDPRMRAKVKTARDAAAYACCDMHRCTIAQVATVFGLSDECVRVALSRARAPGKEARAARDIANEALEYLRAEQRDAESSP